MVTKSLNTHYMYKTDTRSGSAQTAVCKGVLEQARGAEQHITEAAPNELKLCEGG